jgi:hypothetical protein
MKAIYPSLFFILIGVPTLATAAGSETADSFVQATILGSNRARMTLSFLDASGRQHVERATGEAVPALSVVRPGDQAILSLSTDGRSSVVTRVRVHRPEPPRATATATGSDKPSVATPTLVAGRSLPLRRSWPNPYAKGSRPQADRP